MVLRKLERIEPSKERKGRFIREDGSRVDVEPIGEPQGYCTGGKTSQDPNHEFIQTLAEERRIPLEANAYVLGPGNINRFGGVQHYRTVGIQFYRIK